MDANRRTGAARVAALRDDLQSLAEHLARRRRDHRLPALRRRLPGRGDRLREAMLKDAVDVIPENTPEKEARLAAMSGGHRHRVPTQRRWIGEVKFHRREPQGLRPVPGYRCRCRRRSPPCRAGARSSPSSRHGARPSIAAGSITCGWTGSTSPRSGPRFLSSTRRRCARSPASRILRALCLTPEDGIADHWRLAAPPANLLFYPQLHRHPLRPALVRTCTFACIGVHAGAHDSTRFPLGIHPGRADLHALGDPGRHRHELGRRRHDDTLAAAARADQRLTDGVDGHARAGLHLCL